MTNKTCGICASAPRAGLLMCKACAVDYDRRLGDVGGAAFDELAWAAQRAYAAGVAAERARCERIVALHCFNATLESKLLRKIRETT